MIKLCCFLVKIVNIHVLLNQRIDSPSHFLNHKKRTIPAHLNICISACIIFYLTRSRCVLGIVCTFAQCTWLYVIVRGCTQTELIDPFFLIYIVQNSISMNNNYFLVGQPFKEMQCTKQYKLLKQWAWAWAKHKQSMYQCTYVPMYNWIWIFNIFVKIWQQCLFKKVQIDRLESDLS